MNNNPITQYDFKPDLPFELEVQSLAGLQEMHRDLFTKPHRINFYDVIWFQSGQPVYIVDFHRIEIQPNTLLFIHKQQVHFYEQFNDCEGLVLLFTDTFFRQAEADIQFLNNSVLFNDLLQVPCFQLKANDFNIPNLFLSIQQELNAPNDAFKFRILHNLVFTLLLFAERAYKQNGLIPIHGGMDLDIAMRFRNLVDQHFVREKSVGFYAQQLHITEKRLQKTCAQIFGISPKAYISERIVLEAKRLLLHSQANTKAIAFELGFDEPTNFIKYFRKNTQKTPVEFRETYFPA